MKNQKFNIPPFYVGQKVVSLVNEWCDDFDNDSPGPSYGAICHVSEIFLIDNEWCLFLREFSPRDKDDYFYYEQNGEVNFKPAQEFIIKNVSYSEIIKEIEISSN